MVNSFNTFIHSQTKKHFVKMLEIPYINFLCSKHVRHFFFSLLCAWRFLPKEATTVNLYDHATSRTSLMIDVLIFLFLSHLFWTKTV